MDNGNNTQIINNREIDLRQVLLRIMMRWKLLLLAIIIGGAVGWIYVEIHNNNISTSNRATTTNITADDTSELNSIWLDEAERVLAEGMPEQLPENWTELQYISSAFSVLNMMATIEAKKIEIQDRKASESDIPIQNRLGHTKYVIFGIVCCLFLLVAVLLLYEFFSGVIISTEEMKIGYGLTILGYITNKKTDKIQRFIQEHGVDGLYVGMKPDEQMEIVSTNISVYAEDKKEFLLIGSLDKETLDSVAKQITQQYRAMGLDCVFETAAHLLENAKSMQKLKEHESIIIVEEAGKSLHRYLERETELLAGWNKNIVGAVLLG